MIKMVFMAVSPYWLGMAQFLVFLEMTEKKEMFVRWGVGVLQV